MRAKRWAWLAALAPLLFMAALGQARPYSPSATQSVYGDALINGWGNWSWNTSTNLASASMVHGGAASVAATYTAAGWGALYFGRNDGIDVSSYNTIDFWLHGGSSGGQQIEFKVGYKVGNTEIATVSRIITGTANTWVFHSVPLAGLGDHQNSVNQIWWQSRTGGAQPTFYVDDVQFNDGGVAPTPTRTLPPGSGPALSVDVAAERYPISPYIYGMNFAPEALAAELDLPVRRWGGNGTTRYNWQTNFANHTLDWYFENIPQARDQGRTLPDGSAVDLFVEQDQRTGSESLLTMSMIGWTPRADSPAAHPYFCGFKQSKYGQQQENDWEWDADCGKGVLLNGTPITGNDPLDTSTPITQTFIKSWIAHLIENFGPASGGGVQFYNLDNEVDLWHETHRDVHPQGVTYNELRDRTYTYARAIKEADPGAKTLGPVSFGWTGYLMSGADMKHCGENPAGGSCWANPPDRAAHGGKELVEWYLEEMKRYEDENGLRILDYLDLHYYPQEDDIALETAGDAAHQACRLKSTRALWDATYDPDTAGCNSWIDTPPRLIPRMHDWVDQNYPGTLLAMTEYNWGGLEHINGGLAQADVLGIFGRERMDLATHWGPPSSSQPGAYAFRMYRNYDGSGGRFGDTNLRASSSNQEQLSIYAAERSADGALTIIVINKTQGALSSTLSVAGASDPGPVQVYRYSGLNLGAIEQLAGTTLSGGVINHSFPASSITLFVIPQNIDIEYTHTYLPLTTKE